MSLLRGLLLPMVPAVQALSLVQYFEIINVLDLLTLSIAIWTLWTSITLPLGGTLQRAFRLISLGALAFALSHILDAYVQETHLLSTETATLCHQAGVLTAMMLFVAGIARLANVIPGGAAEQPQNASSSYWTLVVGVVISITAFSFIMYGFSLESAAVAFIGIDSCLLLMVVLCFVLLLRARIGGQIGRALWLAFLGLLLFGLAHPLQSWTLLATPTFPPEGAIFHRIIVIPAFLLFASSLMSLARTLSRARLLEGTPFREARRPAEQAKTAQSSRSSSPTTWRAGRKPGR